jgi:hypothetical protein
VGTPNDYCTHNCHYNIVTLLEFGKMRGGIRRSREPSADGLTDISPLVFGVGPSPRAKRKARGQ